MLERFANDGAALGGNPPDSKRAADVRTHAFAERQHMPPIRQGLEMGSVAMPSPVRIALERDLTLRARPERGEWGLIGRDGGASRRVLNPDLEVPCGPRLPGGNLAAPAFVPKQT